MAVRKPIVMIGGRHRQLPAGDTLDTGVTRTYQDMTASRAVSTTYTAPSDRSIHVIISAAAASNVYVHAKIGSLPVFGNGAPNVVSGDDVATVSFEVPPGGTYRLEAISGTLRWLELR